MTTPDTPRPRCARCGREKNEAKVPADASNELEMCLVMAARVCRWCSDVNLLGGGWEPQGLADRWSKDELAELYAEAQELWDRRVREARVRKLQNRLSRAAKQRINTEPAQGSMV